MPGSALRSRSSRVPAGSSTAPTVNAPRRSSSTATSHPQQTHSTSPLERLSVSSLTRRRSPDGSGPAAGTQRRAVANRRQVQLEGADIERACTPTAVCRRTLKQPRFHLAALWTCTSAGGAVLAQPPHARHTLRKGCLNRPHAVPHRFSSPPSIRRERSSPEVSRRKAEEWMSMQTPNAPGPPPHPPPRRPPSLRSTRRSRAASGTNRPRKRLVTSRQCVPKATAH